MATWLDGLLATMKWPRKADAVRRLQAARVDRFTSAWRATAESINKELQSDLDATRARARDLVKNNEYAHKFVKMCVSNVIGPGGFILQGRARGNNGQLDRADNDAIEMAFWRWSKKGVCDITGTLSFPGLCRAILSGCPTDGEFLVRKIVGRDALNEFGFALQLIDIDRLNTKLNIPATPTRNAIIMGVEINTYGRPVAYHIMQSHPADNGSMVSDRVDASEIIHGFMTEHAEQKRGLPWMTSAILSMHHLGKFEESALLAARKGADTLGFIVSPNGSPEALGNETAGDDPITVSVPGMFDTLPDGFDFKPFDTKYPDAMVADFTKGFLRRIASGFNVTYNGLANDLEDVNYSSIRAGVIEERDQWLTMQSWFMESFLSPVYEAWLQSALLLGAIRLPTGSALPVSRFEKFREHHWQGRRWQWVDPAKDIKAARDAVISGVLSPQMIAAQQGVDIEDVIDDIRRFQQMTADIGLVSYGDQQTQPDQPPAEDGE